MKKWFSSWWKKEVAVFVAMGTILGVVSACGIVPKDGEFIFLTLTVVVSIVISTIWTFVSLFNIIQISELSIENREGSRRSVTNKYEDKMHKITYLFRQDLLDYSKQNKIGRNFVSIRVIKGKNVSSQVSDGLIYFECTEYKTYCKNIKIKAIDLKTNKSLRVEFIDIKEKNKYFEFPFKIYFATPLQKNDEFEIAYSIVLIHELDVLKEDDEIMSLSLSRYLKGVDEIEFNVCLNFCPSSVHVEHKVDSGFRYDNSAVSVEKYVPVSKVEKMFDIKWSDEPYIIRWHCKKPKHVLYVINYRK